MNSQISEKEVILSLHISGKMLDEIQATIIMTFKVDLKPSSDVNMIFLL